MATRNTVTDEYVVKASISDTASPGLDKLTASMAAADSAAASLADKAAAAGAAIGASGAKFSNAVTQFDQIARRYDDVTKYTLQLAAAQAELQRAQTSGQTALANGTTTQEAYAATIAALTQKVASLAEAQGEARAEAEALSESTARWSGIATQGSAAVSDFAAKISAAAQVQQGLTNQINAWNAATVKATESQRLWNATSGVIIDPAASTADRAADIIAYGAALDSVRAKFNPVFAASKNYEAQISSISEALATGAISQNEATAATEAATAAFSAANQPLADYNAAQVQLAAVTRASFAALDQYSASMDSLRAKYDPVFAANQKYAATLADIAALQEQGATSADVLAAATAAAAKTLASDLNPALDGASNKAKNLTAAHNQASFATRQLGVQTVQFTTMVATGSPIMLAAIQQGHQLLDVALATGTGFEVVTNGVKAAWAAISGFVVANPAIIALTALVGAVTLLTVHSESAKEAMLELQTALRGTRQDYVEMATEATAAAKAVAASQNISSADATAAAKAITASPNFSGTPAQLQALLVTANNLKAINGISFEQFATGLQHVGQFAQTLADKNLPGMSQQMALAITLQEQGGDTAGAFAKVLQIVNAASHGASDNLTDIGKALQGLDQAFHSAGSGAKSFSDIIGSIGSTIVVAAIETLTGLVQEFKQIYDLLSSLKPPPSSATPSQSLASFAWDMTDENKLAAFIASQITGRAQTSLSTGATATTLPSGSPTPLAQAVIAGAVSGNIISAGEGSLATNIAMAESGGNQFDPKTGGVVTSPRGALGQFQLMPATAAGLHVDATQEDQNVQGGLAYIHQLWTKYNGDPQLVAMAYNWGPANVDAFIAGTKTLGQVPVETTNFVLKTTGAAITAATATNASISTGVGQSAQSQIDKAITDAAPDATAVKFAAASARVKEFTAALQLLQDQAGTASPTAINNLNEALNKATLDMIAAVPPVQAILIQDQKTITANTDLAAAYSQGGAAVAELTARNQAVLELVGKLSPASAGYTQALKLLTAANLQVAASAEKVQGAEEGHSLDNSITMVEAETASLGMNSDARTLLLAHMQSELELRDKYKASYDTVGVAILAERDHLAALTLAYQNTQANLSYVAGQFSQAFDTIGNAMSQAFISGQGAAVNWGNVMTAVVQQVIQQFLKLSVLNPLLNSLFSQNNPTLSTVSAALSASSGSAGGQTLTDSNGNVIGTLSTGGSLVSTGSTVSGLFGGPTLGSALGLTGPDGLLGTGGGIIGAGGSLTGAGGIFYQGLSATAAAQASAPLAAGVAGPTLPGATAGEGSGLLGATVNGSGLLSWAGGISGGFALGSLAGGLVQSGLDKTGPAPTIGAGVGAIGGAAIGSFFGPGGTVIGGLLGGLIGGTGGGFIGPHPQSSYSSSALTVANGQFANGPMISQQDNNASAEEAALTTAIANLNTLLAGANIQVTGQSGQIQIGDNSNRSAADPTKFSDLDTPNLTGQTAFSKFSFTSPDATTNEVLAGKTFATTSDFQTWITGFQAAQVAVKAYLTDTTATLKALGATTGSMPDSLNALNAAYAVDKTNMDALLVSGDLTAQQTIDLTKAETDLATVRDKSIQAVLDQVNEHYVEMDQGFTSRQLTAQATISGSPADAETAQLYAFDANAATQVASLKADLISIFGDSVTSSTSWAQQMGALETTLGQERLAITTTYNKQIVAADTTTFTTSQSSLVTALNALISSVQDQVTALTNNSAALHAAADSSTKFAASLSIGANSPLSPLLQLQAAQAQFSSDKMVANDNGASVTDRTAAATALQSDATTLLGLGKTYYASSANYAALFGSTVTALNGTGGSLSTAADASDAALKVQTDQLAMLTSQRDTAQLIGTQIVGSVAQLQAAMTASFAALVAVEGEAAGLSPQQAALAAKQNVGTSADFVAGQYTSTLGRPEDAAGAAYWQNQIDSGAMTRAQVAQAFLSSPEAMQHHAAGGWVTNGAWNSDSVSAMLAGGEYVLSAPSAARYATMLPAMNAGTLPIGAGTNDNAAVLGELRALRTQASVGSVMETRSQTATLVAEIQALRAEVKGLRADVARNATKPARLTA